MDLISVTREGAVLVLIGLGRTARRRCTTKRAPRSSQQSAIRAYLLPSSGTTNTLQLQHHHHHATAAFPVTTIHPALHAAEACTTPMRRYAFAELLEENNGPVNRLITVGLAEYPVINYGVWVAEGQALQRTAG